MAEIISGIGAALRPAAKQLIKGGLVATNAISGFASDTGAEFKGIVVEARNELRQSRTSTSAKARTETARLWDQMVDAAHAAWDATTSVANGIVATANDGLAMLIAWWAGEAKEKAEQEVRKDEAALKHLGKDVAGDLGKEECVNVIETLLVLAA